MLDESAFLGQFSLSECIYEVFLISCAICFCLIFRVIDPSFSFQFSNNMDLLDMLQLFVILFTLGSLSVCVGEALAVETAVVRAESHSLK